MSQKFEKALAVAKALVKYPSLEYFANNMIAYADRFAKQTLECQEDGIYVISEDEFPKLNEDIDFDFTLLSEMLAERPEFEEVDTDGGDIHIKIKPEYHKSEISEDITHEQTM